MLKKWVHLVLLAPTTSSHEVISSHFHYTAYTKSQEPLCWVNMTIQMCWGKSGGEKNPKHLQHTTFFPAALKTFLIEFSSTFGTSPGSSVSPCAHTNQSKSRRGGAYNINTVNNGGEETETPKGYHDQYVKINEISFQTFLKSIKTWYLQQKDLVGIKDLSVTISTWKKHSGSALKTSLVDSGGPCVVLLSLVPGFTNLI